MVSPWCILAQTIWVVSLDLISVLYRVLTAETASRLKKKKSQNRNSSLTVDCRDDPHTLLWNLLHARRKRTKWGSGLHMLSAFVVAFEGEPLMWAFGRVVSLLLGIPEPNLYGLSPATQNQNQLPANERPKRWEMIAQVAGSLTPKQDSQPGLLWASQKWTSRCKHYLCPSLLTWKQINNFFNK